MTRLLLRPVRWCRALGAAALLAAVGSGGQEGPFHVRGLGGAGGMYLPSVSPYDPGLMLLACDMGGAYRSRDGAVTWKPLGTGLPLKPCTDVCLDPTSPKTARVLPFKGVQSIAFHPDDPQRLYLTTFGGGAWVGPHLPPAP